jgi:hypothetical protein
MSGVYCPIACCRKTYSNTARCAEHPSDKVRRMYAKRKSGAPADSANGPEQTMLPLARPLTWPGELFGPHYGCCCLSIPTLSQCLYATRCQPYDEEYPADDK